MSAETSLIPVNSTHITPEHWHEWVIESKVDAEITRINVRSLSGNASYEYLLYGLPDSERRNDGRLRDGWLNRYRHVENGGWWCSGVDVLTGKDSAWGCFKPERPRTEEKPRGFGEPPKTKAIKYEHPPKVATEIFALRVSDRIWWKIAHRYGIAPSCPINFGQGMNRCAFGFTSPDRCSNSAPVVTPPNNYLSTGGDYEFWQWVIDNPGIPLTFTEGAKKAGALLTAGYCAIALPGVFNGYRSKDEQGNPLLHPHIIPQLEAFSQEGREFIFCFDHETKPKTIKNVRQAILKTGKLLARKRCKVSVISWHDPEKGVDDLIAAKGEECFQALYKARISLDKFELGHILNLSPYVTLRVTERYLSDSLVPPPDAQVICIKSAKGTGKTEWLSRQTERAIATGRRVLVITHRIQLARALCDRFGIDHLEQLSSSETGGILGYGLCIDSLHPNSQARFNPSDWEGALVILDECEQVIWHLLNSPTCQKNRVAILDTFRDLLQTVIDTSGKIYLSDADLSPMAINYIDSLAHYIEPLQQPIKRWVVENTFNPNQGKRVLHLYEGRDPRDLVAALVKAISRGDRVIIHTSGQLAKSKWGTQNLEAYLKQLFPCLKLLRIDAESIADPEHPAYGCMGNLNALLPSYDVVIASPTIETGVSIDVLHFDSVWCIAFGVQTVDAVCQTLERVRDDIPRHLWASEYSSTRVGNGSTNPRALLRSEHQKTQANIRLLQQAGIDDFDGLDTDCHSDSLTEWGKRACVVNAGMIRYRESILDKLKAEGYEVIDAFVDEAEAENIKSEVNQVKARNYDQHCQEVASTDTPSASELEELENKRAKTQTERLRERKGQLVKRYATEDVTPDLVKRDSDGWYPKLRLHYFLTIGNTYLTERDRRSLSQMAADGNGKAFKPDINKRQLSAKIKALEVIDIKQFFDPTQEFTSDDLKEWLSKLIQLRYDIKAILGISISEKDTAIAVAQRCLTQLFGLKMEYVGWQTNADGKRMRVYQGCDVNPDDRQAIFERWFARESELYQNDTGSHPPYRSINNGGCAA